MHTHTYLIQSIYNWVDVHINSSSLLIVYEGYEEPEPSLQLYNDPLPDELAANVNKSSSSQGDGRIKLMEDDSHSGNCSYDADASNDSIELNLSLDEQQPCIKQSGYSSHMQSNHVPVSLFYIEFKRIRWNFAFFTFWQLKEQRIWMAFNCLILENVYF